jgi:ABC-type multidrug transport system fused ATPase/permease subunit
MVISYFFEIAGMFLLPLLAVLIAIYIGQLYGSYLIKKSPELPRAAIASIVSAVLSLLTFMLAFTFQIASNHYDTRKTLILEEVSDIRTTYLRTELLKEPSRSDTKKLLTEYVDLWVDLSKDPSKIDLAISRSQKILDLLWTQVKTTPDIERCTVEFGLYSTSVTNLVDGFNKRITLFMASRIPFAVLLVLYVGSFLSMMALGYQFGISGKGGFRVSLVLAFIFAMVIFLILALDHPETRLVKINQQPIITLQEQLHGK